MGKEKLFEISKNISPQKDTGKYCYFGWEGKSVFALKSYADGYKYAAEVIYEKLKDKENCIPYRECLIYPFCFNYRHMMELLITYLALKYCNKKIEYIIKNGHSLLKNWESIKDEIQSILSSTKIDVLDNYIRQMHDFDTCSERMRYPFSKKNNEHNNSTFLDIENLYTKMTEFCDIINELENNAF